MENKNNADIKKEDIAPAADPKETPKENPPQDLLKDELAKVQNKGEGKSKREKLIYTKNRIEQQLAELDGDEGVSALPDEEDENKPLTLKDLRQIQQKEATKTALDLASEISDASERELTKYHLSNSIRSTGNPQEDLSLARAIVNAAKNAKIAEEIARKGTPKDHASGTSAPARNDNGGEVELTREEEAFMRPPFNMTRADILKARR